MKLTAPVLTKLGFLSLTQGLSMTTVNITVICSILAATKIAPEPYLASIPYGLQFIIAMFFSIPVARLMANIGRQKAFIIGQTIGISGAFVGAFGLYVESFYIFCLSGCLIGFHNAFWQYIRFAAAEQVGDSHKSTAISWVLAGGLIAAFLGEFLSVEGKNLIEHVFCR